MNGAATIGVATNGARVHLLRKYFEFSRKDFGEISTDPPIS